MNEISLPVDPLNPGQFYACCGLVELFDLAGGKVESRFVVSDDRPRAAEFQLRSGGQLELAALLGDLREAKVTFSDSQREEKSVKAVGIETAYGSLTLDWWFDAFRDRTTSLKCWAGQVTTEKLMSELLPAIEPDTEAARLFKIPRMMKTRFGIDPRSAWNSLDLGYSPNEQGQDAATYPLVEVLGAIGLQGFRPNSSKREKVTYNLWQAFLPRVPARKAATSGWSGLPCSSYDFRIEMRGQFKFFTFAAKSRKGNADVV